MNEKKIPKSVIERIPLYADYLNKLIKNNIGMISSTTISQEIGLGEVQVRKDLNFISGKGKPKIGYNTIDLRNDVEELIHSEKYTNVAIVGAGKIGEALANYSGFKESGFNILAIFDNDKSKIGKNISGKPVLSDEELNNYCTENNIEMIMLAVPSGEAQNICDNIKNDVVKGILNFTNKKLNVNENICIRNVDIASLLVMLAVEIRNKK